MPEFVISPSIVDHCCSKKGIDDFTKTLALFYLENSLKIVFDKEEVLITEYSNRFENNIQFRAWFDILLGTNHRNIVKYNLKDGFYSDIFLIELAGLILEDEKNLCGFDLSEFEENVVRCKELSVHLIDNEGLKEKIKKLTSGNTIINQSNYAEGGSNIYNEGR